MASLFTTPWGIMCGGVFLVFAAVIVMMKDDLSQEETIIFIF